MEGAIQNSKSNGGMERSHSGMERSHSGLVHTLGKRACRKVSRVRISLSPPIFTFICIIRAGKLLFIFAPRISIPYIP